MVALVIPRWLLDVLDSAGRGTRPRAPLGIEPLEDRVTPAVATPDRGREPAVALLNNSGTVLETVPAYDPAFAGGVWVASADVTGDGVPDLVAAPGPGSAPVVKVFDGVGGRLVREFAAYEPAFTGGVYVAAADLNGDGRAEVVTGTDQGGGPRVRVFDGASLAAGGEAILADFFAIDDPNFRGGVRVALGDVTADGTPDLVVSAGFGGGPRIAGFDGAALARGRAAPLFPDFYAYESALRNGAFVAVGDVTGDGHGDLVFGGGPGGGPRVRVLDGKAVTAPGGVVDGQPGPAVADFFAGDPGDRSGVRVGTVIGADRTADVIALGAAGGEVPVHDGATGARVGTLDRVAAVHGGLFNSAQTAVAPYRAPATGVRATLSAGSLTLTGTDGPDDIRVVPGAAGLLRVMDGRDVVVNVEAPLVARVVVSAGGGDDLVDLSAVSVDGWVAGGDGDDAVRGGGGDDIVLGLGGADALDGGAGRDILAGGDGQVDAGGVLIGPARVDGGDGADYVSLAPGYAEVTAADRAAVAVPAEDTNIEAEERRQREYAANTLAAREQLVAVQAGLNYPGIGTALSELALISARTGGDLGAEVAGVQAGLVELHANAEAQSVRSADWGQAETDRLAAEQAAIDAHKATLDQIVREYRAAWAEVRSTATRNLRIREAAAAGGNPIDNRRSTGGGRPPREDVPPDYIDPDEPITNLNGKRIFVVYDRMVLITEQLKTALASVLSDAPAGLAEYAESVVDGLGAGVDVYYDETSAAGATKDAELTRIDSARDRGVARATADADREIAAERAKRDAKVGPLETKRQGLEDGADADIRAAKQTRDTAVSPHDRAKAAALDLAAREEAAAAGERDTLAGGGGGFALGYFEQAREKAEATAGNATEEAKDAAGNVIDYTQERLNAANDWFEDRKREILDARDRVVAAANVAIDQAWDTYRVVKADILAIRDRAVGQVNTWIAAAKDKYADVVDKLVATRDDVVGRLEAAHNSQAAAVTTLYQTAVSDARVALFDIGEQQLGDVLGNVAAVADRLAEEVATLPVRNPFGTIQGIADQTLGSVYAAVAAGADKAGDLANDAAREAKAAGAGLSEAAKRLGAAAGDAGTDLWNDFVAGLENAGEWAEERWVALKNADLLEGVDWHSGARARVYRITVRPDAAGQFRVDATMAKVDGAMRGLWMTVEHAGRIVAREYTPTGNNGALGGSKTYSLTFPADLPGDYTVRVELKNQNDDWYEREQGIALDLPARQDVQEVFYDPAEDPARPDPAGGAGGRTVYQPSVAEVKRGFQLPYVLAAAGVSSTVAGEYRVDFDAVEVTPETEVAIEYERTNAAGDGVDADGRTYAQLDGWRDALDSWLRQPVNSDYTPRQLYDAYLAEGATTDELGTFNEFLSNKFGGPQGDFNTWYGDTYRVDYAQAPTLEDALEAERVLNSADGFKPQRVAPAPLKGEAAIAAGQAVPSEVTGAPAGQQWAATVTVKEAPAARPERSAFAEKMNPEFFRKVDAEVRKASQGADKFRAWYKGYQAAKEAEAERPSREGPKPFDWSYFRGRISAEKLDADIREVQHELLDAYSILPFFGVFAEGANMVLYAKEGNVGQAAVSGAGVLLDLLPLGALAKKFFGKVGSVFDLPNGKQGVKLEKEFLDQGADVAVATVKEGVQQAAKLRATGINPIHAASISRFAARTDQQRLIVVRAANVNSIQHHKFQGVGYVPKPSKTPAGDAPFTFKTDPATGLVKGSRGQDGTFIDARGQEAAFFVTNDNRILVGDRNGQYTGLRLNTADNSVMNDKGDRYFSDYDLMGVYEPSATAPGKYQQTSTIGRTVRFLDEINAAVAPNLKLFQHGANDEYFKNIAGEAKNANPGVGNLFQVFRPTGEIEVVDLDGLRRIYDSLGILWPL